ncbi:serine/threonine protein kinase [Thiohalospira sp.]|uniref:serine/threonine protein kinase n=1 Tax=Thiohalospira sp. TaxID=3080549 RepID=UPI00397F34DF
MASEATPYADLGPDTVLDAVAATGREPDGRLLPLNSFENRVYRVGLEEGAPVVAKFYRPGRWPNAAIDEEHAFSAELAAADVPVVAPLDDGPGPLREYAGYRFALFPLRGGRPPELEDPAVLERIGFFLGRLHTVGASARFAHRPTLAGNFGAGTVETLADSGRLPDYLHEAWTSVARELVGRIRERWEAVAPTTLRLHGDAHPGNLLWAEGPHIVDLDDTLTGPAVADLWLFLGGEREEQQQRLAALLRGYRAFRDLDPGELALIEALRGLRILRHAGWIAARWADPAFPVAFPWFEGPRFWEDQVLALREQLANVDEPPLELPREELTAP